MQGTTRIVLVPKGRWPRGGALVAAVERLGDVEKMDVTADDVTSQRIDLDARVRAKRRLEARYLELVARAANLDEVLSVERELGSVRAEIEAMESKQRALGDQVALSTLTVTLSAPHSEPLRVAGPDLAAALGTGWSALLKCIVAILTAWPLLAAAAIVLAYRRVRRPRVAPLPAAS